MLRDTTLSMKLHFLYVQFMAGSILWHCNFIPRSQVCKQ